MPTLKPPPALLLPLLLAACGPTGPALVAAPEPVAGPPLLLTPGDPRAQLQAPDTFTVEFETSAGHFAVEVVRDRAPRGADRLFNMVRLGYFDGVRFFRVVPGFIVQFGLHPDPAINAPWQAARIPDDPVQGSNLRGTLTYAIAGPDTRANQFFINLVDNPRLDAQGFAPVGRVISGMETVDRLYSGYGEMAPRGAGPDQRRIMVEGEPYLAAEFPLLDRVVRARVVGGGGTGNRE